MEQRVAILLTTVLGAILLAIFAAVARSAPDTGSTEGLTTNTSRWQRASFWGLVVIFVPVIGYTLTRTPYSSGSQPAAAVIEATGHQWAWQVSPATVPAGQPVEIRVTTGDVNHGFGVYDTHDRLITQTQAMPGFTNVIRHTFSEPGTYRILCLEYCGLGHHTMSSQLVVTPAP